MSHVWDSSPYEGKALLIHLAMADFADDDGTCYPSQTTLAAKARATDRYVRDAIKTMIADGYVEMISVSTGRGSHRYRLLQVPRNSVPPRNSEAANMSLSSGDPGNQPPEARHRTVNEPISASVDAGFEEFYAAYPLRKDRAEALKSWRKAVKVTDPAAITGSLPAYITDCVANKRPYRYPATFLNRLTWMDYQGSSGTVVVPLFCPACDARWSDGHRCGA